jgi:hypothetical protein
VADGCCSVDVFPLPKFQFHKVGLPVDISWKVTISGEQPASGVAVKFAAGAWAKTAVPDRRIIPYRTTRFFRIVAFHSQPGAGYWILIENV